MGCGCGKSRNNPGMTRINPLVLGESGEYQTLRVRMIQGSAGAPAGSKRWVTGSSVETMLESGAIEPV